MYRFAAKRLFSDSHSICSSHPRFSHLRRIVSSQCFSTSTVDNQSFNAGNPNVNQHGASERGAATDYPGSESSTGNPNVNQHGASERGAATDCPGSESSTGQRSRNFYEDEQDRVLRASLPHVNRLGWSEAAMMAGARDAGVSPSIVGAFPRKEAALVEFFMDECLQKLIDRIDTDESLKHLIPRECISKLLRIRLEMQISYITRWAQALSIQAIPNNVPTSFKQRAMVVDEIWNAVGDAGSDIDQYVKRTILGAIYSSTEVYMLADNSQDFQDTWAFLDARVRDAMDLRKTVQEAQHFAEAVGASVASPLQGLAKRVFEGQPFNK